MCQTTNYLCISVNLLRKYLVYRFSHFRFLFVVVFTNDLCSFDNYPRVCNKFNAHFFHKWMSIRPRQRGYPLGRKVRGRLCRKCVFSLNRVVGGNEWVYMKILNLKIFPNTLYLLNSSKGILYFAKHTWLFTMSGKQVELTSVLTAYWILSWKNRVVKYWYMSHHLIFRSINYTPYLA